jgi:hypothetical protein
MADKSAIYGVVRPIIVKKIREAPNDEQALKVHENGEILLFELNRPLSPCSQIAKCLRALGIKEKEIEEILAPFKDEAEDPVLCSL